MQQTNLVFAVCGLLLVSGLFAEYVNIFWKSDEYGIYVIDSVFKKSKVLQRTVKTLGETNWRFTVDETLGGPEDHHLKMGFATKTPQSIKNLAVNKILRNVVKKMYKHPVFLTSTQGRILERGDFDPVIMHCLTNSSKFMAITTLSRKWKKNNYGEITIYDKAGDILRSIHPKFGRIILMPCGIPFKISPPSINVEMRHYFLISEFEDGNGQDVAENDEISNEEAEYPSLTDYFKIKYKGDASSSQEIDPEKVVTRKFFTNEGKKMFVYDNAFPMESIDILHEYIVNHADYHESPVYEKDSADNVKWIISLDDPDFQDGPIWNIIKQLLMHIAGKEFFPYDLACNHVRRTDNTFIHKDNYEDSDEYTVLIYLNKNWTENDYGETTFFQDQEIVAALRPKYGRVAIFHGTIDHSAHPSSPELLGARYTFAIKTAATREQAMSRILHNEADLSFSDVMNKLNTLKDKGIKKQKDFVEHAISTLKSGKIPPSDLLQKLQDIMKS